MVITVNAIGNLIIIDLIYFTMATVFINFFFYFYFQSRPIEIINNQQMS